MVRPSYKKLYQQSQTNLKATQDNLDYYKGAFLDLAKLLGETGQTIINGIQPSNEPLLVDKLVFKMLLYALEMNQRIVGLDGDIESQTQGFQNLVIKGRPVVLKS